jgi:phosphoglycolate phosphatase
MAIRGIIFDKDGTLFDFEATWAVWVARLLTELFGPAAAERGRAIGYDLESNRFAPDSPVISETTAHLAAMLLPHLPAWDQRRLEAHLQARAREVPLAEIVPLAPLLRGLAGEGIALGLATNDDEGSARSQLERAGLGDAFGFVAGYDSGHGGKPAPGQLVAFLAETGLNPAEVAMVGDSVHDLVAGRAAGMRTVGVESGPARGAALAPLADVVLPDISHLPGWIEAQRGT